MKRRFLLFGLLFLIFVFPGCMENNNSSGKETFSISLTYEMTNNNEKDSYLLLPCIESDNEDIMNLFDDEMKNGDFTSSIISTEYGKMINISFSTKFELEYKSEDYSKFSMIDAYKSIDFTARKDKTEQYYIYSNSNEMLNIKIQFDYQYQYVPDSSNKKRPTGTDVEIEIIGELHQGWNLLNATVRKSCE